MRRVVQRVVVVHTDPDGWHTVKPSSKSTTSEQDIQAAVVSYCHAARLPIHHSPNGQRLSVGQAGKLKQQGVSAGFPDLILPTIQTVIELKRADGGQLSSAQKYWLTVFAQIGWHAVCAHGMEAALWTIKEVCANGRLRP